MNGTPFMENLPLILVINLKESQDRLESISANLDRLGLSWQRLDAVDGRTLNPNQHIEAGYCDKQNRRDAFRPLNGGEIGCFLSHRKAWQYMLEHDIEHALILEDDAFPLFEDKRVLQQAMDCAQAFPVVRLNGKKSGLALAKTREKRHGFKIQSYALPPFQTTATSVTKAGANALLNETKAFGLPIDAFYAMPWRHGQANISCLAPALFGNDPRTHQQTTIQHKRTKGENKIRREISRAVYRLKLRMRALSYFCFGR